MSHPLMYYTNQPLYSLRYRAMHTYPFRDNAGWITLLNTSEKPDVLWRLYHAELGCVWEISETQQEQYVVDFYGFQRGDIQRRKFTDYTWSGAVQAVFADGDTLLALRTS